MSNEKYKPKRVLAYFNAPAKGGYYHLSVRALQDYRNYPKMKLAVKISPVVFK